jgi:hypothetical protein
MVSLLNPDSFCVPWMNGVLFRGKALSPKKRIPDSPQAYYEGEYTARPFPTWQNNGVFRISSSGIFFKNEPGVFRVLRPEKSNGRKGGFKREYESMRIPESVARRVYERLVSKAA